MAYDPKTAERVRRLLSSRKGVEEKRMVGGLSFSVDGTMCCGVSGNALMVRVGAAARERTLTEPHVRPMVFGKRPLAGFVLVDRAGYRTDASLRKWIQRGLDFATSLSG